jgi:hypothetical protein
MERALARKPSERAEAGTHAKPRAHPSSGGRAGASAGVPLFLRRAPLSPTETEGVEQFGGAAHLAADLPRDVTVGGLDDPEEAQAERIARAVTSSGAAGLPPEETAGATSDGDVLRREPLPTTPAPAAASSAGSGPGAPMAPGPRATLERGLGVDLGGVRVHRDRDAGEAARTLGARAFTVGRSIWLGHGETEQDLGLMAHETAHVLQADGVLRRAPAAAPPAPPAPAPARRDDAEAMPPAAGASVPAAAGGEATAVPLQMPEPPDSLSPAAEQRVAQAQDAAGVTAASQADLPSADAQTEDARTAVAEPDAETEGRAQGGVVAELVAQAEPSPEIEELCQRIYRVIREKRPPDEDRLVDADPQAMAADAGSQLNTDIQGDTERVQGSYDRIEETPDAVPEQTGAPLEGQPAAEPGPNIGADRATPDPLPPGAVSLDADVTSSQERMADAGMESEPARLVESGPIAEAREAQGELSEMAERDPAEVIAEQQAALARAGSDMASLQQAATEALAASRGATVQGVGGQQEGMVDSEERTRERIGEQARAVFSGAQERVRSLLEPLPRTAMARWDAEKEILAREFRDSLARVRRWIDERHSGAGGLVLSAVDYLTGLPGWVTEEYDRAEQRFGDGVCRVIREISRDVNGVIAACEAIIDEAHRNIDRLYSDLPAELQEWAASERARFAEQLDGLRDQARDTRDGFNRDLVQRAGQAVQEVREEVHTLRQEAGGLLGRIADAVGRFLDDPAKFIIEGLLQLLGIAPSAFWAVVARIGEAIESIADDPLGFAGNLLAALAQGFRQFFDNIGQHLLQGLLDWLFSGLGSVGVQLPGDLSLRSIVTFFLQLMGLTWTNIRVILARHIGEENVALIEKAWELMSTLIEMGPEGLLEMVKEQLDPANLLSMVLEAAVDYLVQALIRAVTPRIIALFNPAGAILQAIEAIYRVLNWIFTNAARIFSLVETVVNGVTNLIAGNIGGMATAVEGALARLLTPVIDFLAGYLGLGDLPEKIADVIRGFQQRVLGIVDRIIGFLAERARALLRALGIGADDDAVNEDDPEKAERVRVGLAAIETEEEARYGDQAISREEAEAVAAKVRREHSVFTSLTVVEGENSFDFEWTASPGGRKPGKSRGSNAYNASKNAQNQITGSFADFPDWSGYEFGATSHPANAKYGNQQSSTVAQPNGMYVLGGTTGGNVHTDAWREFIGTKKEDHKDSLRSLWDRSAGDITAKQSTVIAHLGVGGTWTSKSKAALLEDGAKKLIEDEYATYGLPYQEIYLTGWDEHHIHPINWGGTNRSSNLQYLRRSEHSPITGWWNSRAATVRGFFP